MIETSGRRTDRNAASSRREEVLRDRRRHAEPDRSRHRPQRDRMGPYAARGGRRLRGRGRSAAHRPSHRLRRQLRSRQPPLHQRALRSQSQSRAGHPDRDPDRAAGPWVPVDPGGRLRRRVQGLQRLLRDDPDAGAGPPQDRRGLPGGADETRRRRARRAGGHRQRRRARRTRRTPFMRGDRSFARATPTSTRSLPFSTRARRSRSMRVPAAPVRHDEVVATAARLKAPMAHTSRGKDFVEYDNPYNVGMTGIIGGPAGYHAVLDCDVLLLLGADFAWSQFYPDKRDDHSDRCRSDPHRAAASGDDRRRRRYQDDPGRAAATPRATR